MLNPKSASILPAVGPSCLLCLMILRALYLSLSPRSPDDPCIHLMLLCERFASWDGWKGKLQLLTELLRMASIFSSSADPLSTLLLYATNCWRSFRSRQVCKPRQTNNKTSGQLSLWRSFSFCHSHIKPRFRKRLEGYSGMTVGLSPNGTPCWSEVYRTYVAWFSSMNSLSAANL